MIQHKHIISFAMACNVCDGKGDCSMPCVMGSWIAWPTVGWDKKVIQKCFSCEKKQVNHTTFLVWPTSQLYLTCAFILCLIAL